MNDLRASIRSLRSTPSASGIAVAVISVGILGALVVFALVDAVVLRGIPFRDGGRLVVIGERPDQRVVATNTVDRRPGLEAPQNLLEWRSLGDVFEAVEASRFATFTLVGQGQSEKLRVQLTTVGLTCASRSSITLFRCGTSVQSLTLSGKRWPVTEARTRLLV